MFDENNMIDCSLIIHWSNNDGTKQSGKCIDAYTALQLEHIENLCCKAKYFRRVAFFAFGTSKNWRIDEKFDELSAQLTAIVRDKHGLPIFNLGPMYDSMEKRNDWHFDNTTNNKNIMAQAAGVVYHVFEMLDYTRLVCWGSKTDQLNSMHWATEVTQGNLHMLVPAPPRGNPLKGFPHPAQLRETSSTSAAFSSTSS